MACKVGMVDAYRALLRMCEVEQKPWHHWKQARNEAIGYLSDFGYRHSIVERTSGVASSVRLSPEPLSSVSTMELRQIYFGVIELSQR